MSDLDTIKLPTETWQQWCLRVAKMHGLQAEIAKEYAFFLREGYGEQDAAEIALNKWDV